MQRLNIRWKLTLWYGGVLAAVILLFGTTVYLMMGEQLMERVDDTLSDELEHVLAEMKPAATSVELKSALQRRFFDHGGFDFQVSRSNGERFFWSRGLSDSPLPQPTQLSSERTFDSAPLANRGDWRIVSVGVQGPDEPLTVQVSKSLDDYEHEINELLAILFLAGPLSLIAAVSGGYVLASRALTPVQEMTRAARSISAERLSDRVAILNTHDELGELGATLNDMIERLERSFNEMRRFTADAAHELRTPLAVIRSEAEIALRQPRSGEEYRDSLGSLLEDANRLSVLADQLLFLSRQDAGLGEPADEAVQLDSLLKEVVGNMAVIAQAKGVNLLPPRCPSIRLTTDGRLLRRVLVNLVDNAIKYTSASGTVSVACEVGSGGVCIEIRDTGVGISAEHLPRIFERFYRADPGRSGEGNGIGLGLAISQAIVRNLHGRIDVVSKLGVGAAFSIALPLTRKTTST